MGAMRRTAVLSLILVLLGCVATQPQAPPPQQSAVFRAGEAALLADEFAAAERAFTQALEEAGTDADAAAEASYWVGICRHKLENPSGARTAYSNALRSSDPAVATRARLRLGDLSWAAHDWPAAREMYATARENSAQLSNEERDYASARYGRAAIRAGDWGVGIAVLTQGGGVASQLIQQTASDGQFVCAIGPLSRTDADRLFTEITDARGAAAISNSDGAWFVIVRPVETWDAAAAEAGRWRAKKVSAAALP
jgi:hypothetical protein